MSVKIEGLEKVIKKIESLNKPGAFRAPMEKSLNHLEGKLKRDPTKDPTAFSRLATKRQKKAYWARVSSGKARHGPQGYIRSHKLYRGWKKRTENGGRTGLVYNDTDYGPFVEGLRQQPFHKASNWPRVDEVAKDEAKIVIGIFKRHYEKLLRR